jgi:hypothetical protein
LSIRASASDWLEVGALADQLRKVRTIFAGELAVVAQGTGEDTRDNTVHRIIADRRRAVVAEQAVDVA